MARTEIGVIVRPDDPSFGVTEEELTEAIETHVVAPEPHPAYDDNMNLIIYFENGLA